MTSSTIHPVILIGGSGTRLWPLSRNQHPKQFAKFVGNYSLFQQTILRLQGINHIGTIYLVVSQSNYFLCIEQLAELTIQHKVTIIVEPVARNTAPAVAIAAHAIQSLEKNNSFMLVLPSDHQINDNINFIETINRAAKDIDAQLILFGITPNAPATGYGYIQTESEKIIPAKVTRFLEKPSLSVAEKLIQQKNCFWNSGMFFFSTKTIITEFEKHALEINTLAKKSVETAAIQGNTIALNTEFFSQMPATPIDITIMEKTAHAYVYPLQSQWSDLGDWNAIYHTEKPDEHGNVSIGNVVSLSTKNSYLHSPHKLLTTIGIDNLVVVSTKDSTLIADKKQVQEVKQLVHILKNSEHFNYAEFDAVVHRPWGSYESVVRIDNFQVKHIIVKPGGKLSLQSHQHRSEHWIVVRGIAEVICGDRMYQVHENESTYISKKTKHRLMNLQNTPLHLIEVQVGDYLGEDDIERYDDVYGRLIETY